MEYCKNHQFILSCYCPVCRRQVIAHVSWLSLSAPLLRDASALCLSPEIRLHWNDLGILQFIHRPCGCTLSPDFAQPATTPIVINERRTTPTVDQGTRFFLEEPGASYEPENHLFLHGLEILTPTNG